MLKKTITYIDFDGNERTEDFYFNLTKAECMEMEADVAGGLTKFLEKIIAEQDKKRIVEYMKEFVLRAYGEKSLDGRRFDKSDAIRDSFAHTEAYSVLFMELANDAKAAADFFNGVIPNANTQPVKATPVA